MSGPFTLGPTVWEQKGRSVLVTPAILLFDRTDLSVIVGYSRVFLARFERFSPLEPGAL